MKADWARCCAGPFSEVDVRLDSTYDLRIGHNHGELFRGSRRVGIELPHASRCLRLYYTDEHHGVTEYIGLFRVLCSEFRFK